MLALAAGACGCAGERRPPTLAASRSVAPPHARRLSLRFRRPFYGWWIVGAAIVCQALPSGLLQNAFGTYVVLLGRDYGWSRTTLAGAFSFMRVEEGLLGPLQGWMLDRWGPRRVMQVGMLIFGGGFFIFARIDSIAGFYGAFLTMAIGSSMAGFLSLTTAIVNWFDRKRSLAMGLALLGGAVGGLILPPVVYALDLWGWRAVANGCGVIVLALGLPVVQLIRHRPEQYGLLPDGRAPELAADGSVIDPGERVDDESFTTREAMRTRAFWLISLAHMASVLVVSVVQVHFTAHVTESLGYSLQLAAAVVTAQTVTNLIGRPLGGWMADRTGSRFVIFLAMIGHALALLLLAYGHARWMVFAFALLNGLAWGVRVPVIVSMRAEYFGSRSFGSIMGMSSMVVTAAAVVAPVVAGLAFDAFGSYTLVFTVLAVLAGLGSLFLVFLPPPTRTQHHAAPADELGGIRVGR